MMDSKCITNLGLVVFLLAWWLPACGSRPGIVGVESEKGAAAFDTHTVGRIDGEEGFNALAAEGNSRLRSVKFLISDFSDDGLRRVQFMDGRFYRYHDEWYWFLRMNRQRALGDAPFRNLAPCETPAACADGVRRQETMPRGLRFVDDRLYADRFYAVALSQQRNVGLGALLRLPGAHGVEFGFRLEYQDEPSVEDVLVFFHELERALAPEMARGLQWITRSPQQEKLAAQMVHKKQLMAEQVVDFSAFAQEGEAEIYNPGVTVGRLMRIEAGTEPLANSSDDYILILERVPDELPAAAGIITAVPMTPLSHVNLLAANRGIPSLYVGGVLKNDYMKQLADGYAKVIVDASGDTVRVRALTDAQYARFATNVQEVRYTAVADYMNAPYSMTLAAAEAYSHLDKSALVGGKAAGFEVLYRAVPTRIPNAVMLVTTRAYAEHISPFEPEIGALLAHPKFINSAKVRYFVLEGAEAFQKQFNTQEDKTTVQRLRVADPLLYKVGMAGGVKGKLRQARIPGVALQHVTAALKNVFAAYPPGQGLRFRSSATVEDVDGFSGAGLYVSSTGFLDNAAAARTGKASRTVAWALKRTWASYWNFQAFEERRRAGIDHLTGAMGVVVHARFDDKQELANGVVTLVAEIGAGPDDPQRQARMRINAQVGAVSVTNPDAASGATPATFVVKWEHGPRQVILEQLAVLDGTQHQVLELDDLEQLATLCYRVVDHWVAHDESVVAPTAVSLDFEFKKMAPQWRGHVTTVDRPQLVLKQVRALAPAPRIRGIRDQGIAAPVDVLLRATRVEQLLCAGEDVQARLVAIEMGHNGLHPEQTRYYADVNLVVGSKMVALAATDYAVMTSEPGLLLAPAVAARLGMDTLLLSQMVCESSLLASADEMKKKELGRKGQVIGRVKAVP